MSAITLQKPLRRERHAFDAYSTPRAFVEKALELVDGPPRRVLDVGAGNGIWGSVARERWPQALIYGVDIQPLPQPDAYDLWETSDFLTWSDAVGFDLVMGNPPYGKATEFIEKSISLLSFGGVCVFLLRLSFLESRTRARGLFREYPPEEVRVSSVRPQFYGTNNGGSAYGFYRWRKDHRGETRLTWSET